MTARDKTTAARQRVLKSGDYVLYRDPALFWSGKPDHTKVCRVITRWTSGRLELLDVATDRAIHEADADYTRWLAPEDAMHDIDTAPLDEPDAGAMSAAAVAWLRRLTKKRVPEKG